MAIIRGGILGNLRGKVAGVVGGQWKNKNYVREYVKPANPNTTGQQLQRTAFSDAVAFFGPLVGQVINPFVDPFQREMSGFNKMIQVNIDKFKAPIAPLQLFCTLGKLYPAIMEGALANAGGTIVSFLTDTGINGTANDKVSAVVVKLAEDTLTPEAFYFSAAPVNRSTGTISIVHPAIEAPSTALVFIWAAQYDVSNNLVMVSDSSVESYEPA